MDAISQINLLARRVAGRLPRDNRVRLAAARVWQGMLTRRPYVTLKINGRDIRLHPDFRSHALTYEAESTRCCFALCGPDAVVWDVGANIGLYSLQLALYNPPKRIVAFEFHPETARLLSMHIDANAVGDLVKVMQIAVTDGTQAELEVSLDGCSAGDPCARTTLAGSTTGRRVRVRAASIDSLIEEHGEAPTFLKVDVEGAEYDVLTGARKLLQGSFGERPMVMMAAHPMFIGEFGRSLADVTALIRELGYVSLTSSGQPEDPERYDEFWLVPGERQAAVSRVLAGA